MSMGSSKLFLTTPLKNAPLFQGGLEKLGNGALDIGFYDMQVANFS
jgi:hypothetical protein